MDEKEGYNKKLLVFFVVFFVVIAFLAIYGAEHYNGHDETIELENYCKISDSNLINGNHNTYVYYITWNGSPVGDAGSWAIYKFLESNGINMTGSFKESKSMNGYEYTSSIPGLIFTQNHYNVTYNNMKTIIIPIYLYGENLTDKTNVTAGLQTLKGEVPASIYNEIKIYTTEAIIDGQSISSDNFTNISHINSVTLITGPSGAYILNGYIVNPGDFINNNTTLPPGTVLKDINNKNSGITDGMEGLETTIKDVQ